MKSPAIPPTPHDEATRPPHAGFMNVYHGVRAMPVYPTRKEADKAAKNCGFARIACVYVAECEEPK